MSKNKRMANRKGFTLIELTIATGLASIVIGGVGMLVVDSQRGWNKMYNRTYSGVITDSHVARRTFDRVVRNASNQGISLADDGSWVEVYYYGDPNSTIVDRYARFISSNSQLFIEDGVLEPRQTSSTETICGNVSSCVFKTFGSSVQMICTLDNGSENTTIVASAIPHNQ